jgi:putative transposase
MGPPLQTGRRRRGVRVTRSIALPMRHDPDIYHRRSIRLPGYDYIQPGAYFVTICTQGRECLFGEIVGDEMISNDAGRMIETWWRKLPAKFPSCNADAFVVMPNHLHGVIVIDHDTVRADPRVRPEVVQDDIVGADPRVRPALPRIVQWFKTMTTNAYIHGTDDCGWRPFVGRLWQRNYYDHIVRDEEELRHIREYVVNNPLNWTHDREHPLAG